jgi:chitin synthase
MNPGDLFHDPSRRPYDPYDPNQHPNPHDPQPGHAGQQFAQAPYIPSTTPNPYDNQQQLHMRHSQSQPFPQAGYTDPLQAPQQHGYGDPFRDGGATEQQWDQPAGSHHYPSYPVRPSSTAPAPLQHPSAALSPARQHMALEPAWTRFDSNPSYMNVPHSGSFSGNLPNMPDNRLSSPPPLLQHSSSDMLYPPGAGGNYGLPHSNSFGGSVAGPDEGDMMDSSPLLNHAQPAFGPGSGSRSGRMGYQLRDDGDMGTGGVMPRADEDVNVHYGPVPTRVVRRNKTQKRVK